MFERLPFLSFSSWAGGWYNTSRPVLQTKYRGVWIYSERFSTSLWLEISAHKSWDKCFFGPAVPVHWRWWLRPHSCFTGRAQVNVLYGTRNSWLCSGPVPKPDDTGPRQRTCIRLAFLFRNASFHAARRSWKKMHALEVVSIWDSRLLQIRPACNLIPCLRICVSVWKHKQPPDRHCQRKMSKICIQRYTWYNNFAKVPGFLLESIPLLFPN